ncbi:MULTISPECIES: hypothetical protein [Halobacterium]|uniref:hypothetical protein n=1 Tax=Halobacterium TaxID=2239 RepID=UPI000B298317|nr:MULTISPECIES: hypothetical protein [Halobacterium]MCG1004939.1 hypothetical protein [Halobacterium noricense]
MTTTQTPNDITKVGIDLDDTSPNATVDESVADDIGELSGSNDGTTLNIGPVGTHFLQNGGEVVVAYEDVQNPPAGQYSISVDVNRFRVKPQDSSLTSWFL